MSLWIYKKRPDASGGRDIVLLPIAEMLLPARGASRSPGTLIEDFEWINSVNE